MDDLFYYIPFWLGKLLVKKGKDAVYYREKYPGWRTVYSQEGKRMWTGGFPAPVNSIPCITWEMMILDLFKKV